MLVYGFCCDQSVDIIIVLALFLDGYLYLCYTWCNKCGLGLITRHCHHKSVCLLLRTWVGKCVWCECSTKVVIILGTVPKAVISAPPFNSEWLSPFTPKSDQFQISPAASPEYYITQYGGLGFPSLTQMKDDYTTNSHYSLTLIHFSGRMYTLLTWEWKGYSPPPLPPPPPVCSDKGMFFSHDVPLP